MYIVPVWKGGSSGYRYDIELDGRVIVAGSRAPLGDAARWCAGAGVDGVVEVWRYGGSAAAMRAPVARAARFTTHEGERAGPPTAVAGVVWCSRRRRGRSRCGRDGFFCTGRPE